MTGLAVLAFLGELALLAALAVAGARLGEGAWGVLLAVALPLALAVVWGRWLAPRAPRPLPRGARPAAELALVVGAAGLLAVSGRPGWAVAVLLGVGAVFLLAERQVR